MRLHFFPFKLSPGVLGQDKERTLSRAGLYFRDTMERNPMLHKKHLVLDVRL